MVRAGGHEAVGLLRAEGGDTVSQSLQNDLSRTSPNVPPVSGGQHLVQQMGMENRERRGISRLLEYSEWSLASFQLAARVSENRNASAPRLPACADFQDLEHETFSCSVGCERFIKISSPQKSFGGQG